MPVVAACSDENVPDVWSVCDIALIHLKDDPVFSEVIPSKLFEAMGMGRPLLLVAPPGEASRIVEESGAGLCVGANDPDAFADCIRGLHAQPERLRIFAQRSFAAAPRYSRRKQADDMARVLEAVISGRGHRAAHVLET